ncbi:MULTISPECIES: helix-turn-helix domain-containing protein [Chromatiaceae]|uniref:Excisionase n=1 Tax=Lamprobacter modestohalophilus TaxID=1064514 RepID=A0A9X1B3C4_9GAMM|nr:MULTISPECIES: helix-turn-helix domain-containing protein [Chromatiaceae]MBK1617447.1 excisionase [Lamprobacter modestohalophilus]MBK5940340.1 excisionase [Halochromatium roseum]
MTTIERVHKVASPVLTAADKDLARAAQRCIMGALDHSRAAALVLTTENGEHPQVEVPPAALRLIGQLLGAISQDKSVVLMPAESELTTVEAAHFLNVSRPFVIKEMEAGRLPYRKVGTHRRVTLNNLMIYERAMRQQQEQALERMADNARELGLDY